jgi:hypothetical protein
MGTFSDYTENKWLNHILEGSAFTSPAVVAIAFHTGDPGDTGANNECTNANNYARKSCKASFATAAATRIISNDADIVMNQASGSWGTVSYWSLWDSATYGAGNCLCTGSFSTGKAIAANQTPKILTGEIDISIPSDNGMSTYLANEMLDHTFLNGDAGFAQPTIYMALGVTASFGDGGSLANEVSTSGTAYARMATGWTVSGSGATNNGAITFPVATASWGTVTYYALVDGATEGADNVLLYGDWAGVAITTDDQVNIPDGDIDITLS